MLKVNHIVKEYAKHRALDDVSLEVEKGTIFGLLGPNGAGKTSLIRIINQITAPDQGEILFNGEKLNQSHISKIGYLPEERGLYKKMEIGEQMLYLAQLKGLSRAEEGSEVVERVIISGGSVQMGLMEKGVSWISLFIALAPMLGFLGTVLGMIDSFNAIEEAGGIKPTVVAGGIKTALITTVAGLVVAIILQVFYNVIVAKIDNLVNSMEDASNTFMKIVKSRLDK